MAADRGLRWRAAAVLTALTAPALLALHALALHLLAQPVLLAPPGTQAVTALAATLLAGTVLAGLLAACLAGRTVLAGLAEAVPLTSRAAALREKSRGAAFLRQRDPDAAGRPRPRAPGGAPAAASS